MERLHRAASRATTGCLSSFAISVLLSEASPPPLRVTLTHFTLSSYERALRLPTSFPISGLARLGVKPRLCRSSWRALASTHPLMLPSTFSREALLACPRFPPWNLPSFTVESTLSSPCSRSDPPLSRQNAFLADLDSLPSRDLVLWTDGSVSFPFGKGGPAYLPTAVSVALRPLIPFQQAQFVPVFPLKPAPFCTLFAGLGSTNKSSTSPLLLSDSRSVLSSIFPVISNSVADLAGTVFSLLLFYQATMGPRHSFLPGYDAADELASWGALLAPSATSCSLSPLTCRIQSCLFSDWRRTVSSKFFATQVRSISTEELCSLCPLSSTLQRTQSVFRFFPLSKICRIENPSCSACGHSSQGTSHLILYCPATDSLATRCLSTTSGELPGFWGSMVFRHAPFRRKGSGNQQQPIIAPLEVIKSID